jgi:hypothetical protein
MEDKNEGTFTYENMPSAFDLHSTLATQAGVNKIELQEIMPKHSIEATGPIEFTIPSGANQVIDPNGMLLELEVQIRSQTGDILQTFAAARDGGADTPQRASWVLPVNNLSTALFKDLEIRINNYQIGKTDGLYAYKADFATRLKTSVTEKEHVLGMGGYIPEEDPFDNHAAATITQLVNFDQQAEVDVIGEGGDDGLNMRWLKTRGSRTWQLTTPLYGELFQQIKYLPPRAQLTITLHRNEPKFYLLSKEGVEYRLHIVKANLLVKMVEIEEKMIEEMEFYTYKNNDMIYPIQRIQMAAFSRSAGSLDLSIPDLFQGSVVPRRLFVTLVKSEAFYGNYNFDPFNFKHYFVKEISLKINGSTSRLRPITCDYARRNYSKALISLLTATNCLNGDSEQIGINIDNFPKRNVIYAFDPTGLAGGAMADSFVKEEKGTVGLTISCSEALPEEVMVLVYSEFDAEIRINKEGVPSMDEFA